MENNKNNKLYNIIFILVIILITLFLGYNFKFVRVSGESMEPTLHSGQFFLFSRGTPTNGEVVIFKSPKSWEKNEEFFIKRVVGRPGDTVEITKDTLFVNDKPIEKFSDYYGFENERPIKFKLKNEYFVLGDNQHNSYDSLMRYLYYGDHYTIPAKDVDFGKNIPKVIPK